MLKVVLIDLSGTLHIGDQAIAGAVEALARLRASNFVIRFLTNTTKESKKTLLDRLLGLGFNIKESEIYSSLTATRQLVEKRKLRPFLILEDDALNDFEGIDTRSPNAVVVGLAPSKFDYSTLNEAFKLLTKEKAAFIAIHKGRFYERFDGLALGPGAFVKGLEYATERTAEVVGKPQATFFNDCLQLIGCQPSEVIIVGDDVHDDIGGAQAIGVKGILVKTGKYREGDECKISPPPKYVCENFRQAVDILMKY